eukprot:TRINITY_DN706_c0_g1_i10.p1 TRINITY_DN706_c0_g1~~TRINITY_DN706_c0_g1_i10.p1  ORF type:complete len:348 (-),score=56.92 TRINITY_DN706_c0_g1_i10:197-1207(-)
MKQLALFLSIVFMACDARLLSKADQSDGYDSKFQALSQKVEELEADFILQSERNAAMKEDMTSLKEENLDLRKVVTSLEAEIKMEKVENRNTMWFLEYNIEKNDQDMRKEIQRVENQLQSQQSTIEILKNAVGKEKIDAAMKSVMPQCEKYHELNHYRNIHDDKFDSQGRTYFDILDAKTWTGANGQSGHPSPDWVGTGWYRFVGPSGHKMPEYAPGYNSCGTWRAGWLRDSHPSVPGMTINGTVCFDSGYPCSTPVTVKVTNCGEFFVYYLPDMPDQKICGNRYCATNDELDWPRFGLQSYQNSYLAELLQYKDSQKEYRPRTVYHKQSEGARLL